MRSEPRYLFQSFEFDPANAQLWHGQKEITIRRKTFEVLQYLIDRPGQLVTKAALLDEIWPKVVVSDSMPAICISELRKVLGDDANDPRFIETVPRRGYRFVAKVTTAPAVVAATKFHRASVVPGPLIVGRDAELAQLRDYSASARSGGRRLMFISGEAGIGKTTFVEAFLASIATEGVTRIARGQCVEQYGAGEPYMPVLEALTRLGQGPEGRRLVKILRRLAPTWLVQMPALITVEERSRLRAEAQAATQPQRMLREIAQALEALSAESPLVLLLEDLHWSDFATLELISAIARRSEPARLLILGTYRPVELLAEYGLRTMKEELEIHQQCQELRLSLLSRENVADYLGLRFSGDDAHQLGSLAPVIHERTEGNPLFMVNVVDYLVAQGPRLDINKLETPRNIRQMIERNFVRLTAEEQSVLEGASVAGAEFSAATVAAALERPVNEVEACFTRLSHQERFVSAQGVNEWPDNTVASSFRFHHALYRDVLYDRVPAGHRVELHRRIAVREERAYGQRAGEIAAELAHHYRNANAKDKAIEYLAMAGQQAIERSAHADAIGSLSAALELLQSFPDGAERMRRELPLQLALGPTLIPVKGWAAPEVERAYARARELCTRLGDPPAELFLALCGLWAVCCLRAQVGAAYDLADQLMQLAQKASIPRTLLVARSLLGNTLFSMGELPRAREQLEEAFALYNLDDFERRRQLAHTFPVSDQGVSVLSYEASVLWRLGYPDQALAKSNEALSLASALSHPHSVILAQFWRANLRVCLRETCAAQEAANSIIAVSAEHGFTDQLAAALGYNGWALAQQGKSAEGIAQIKESLAGSRAMRMELGRPSLLCLLAEAFIGAGRLDDGLSALTEAEAAARLGEREREPETHRFKGELLLKRDDSRAEEARSCFQRAIETARQQSARSWELRATISLARLLDRQGHRDEARTALAEIYQWFTEGFDTADLKEAKSLLDELNDRPSTRAETRTRHHG